MLIQFTVENVFSFRNKKTLSMVSAPIRATQSPYENMMSATPHISPLLLSTAIYGANASGKSNLIKALDFFLSVINQSAQYKPESLILLSPFLLNPQSVHEPSSFEITFVVNNVIYRYGFVLNSREIVEEWLYIQNKRESQVFERKGNEFKINGKYTILKDLVKKKMVRKNALLLSVAAQFNESTALIMFEWFENVIRISGLNDEHLRSYTQNLLKDTQKKAAILNLLRNADLGIEDILLKEQEIESNTIQIAFNTDGVKADMQPNKSLWQNLNTVKNVFDHEGTPNGQVEMNFDTQESEGTKKMFHLSGLLLYALEQGGVMVIDELDAKLHPLLVLQFISLVHNPKINEHGAQLIFTTHNTNLLSAKLFRRDQIWFTEKNRQGETQLFSLYEFKQRNDSDIEQNYLAGRFGAVPFLKNLAEKFKNE